MCAKKLFFLLMVMYSIGAFTQDVPVFKPYMHTGGLMKKKAVRYSLFSYAEYGLSEKATIVLHPVWTFMAPTVAIKWKVKQSDQLTVSMIQGISSPTPAMRLVAASGTGGLISPEFDIPMMISIRNGVVATRTLNSNHLISGEFAVEFALFNTGLQPGSTIDLPIISPRNAVYYKNAGFDLGLAAEGKLLNKFDYYSKVQLFLFPFEVERYKEEYDDSSIFFGEWTTMLFYSTGSSFKVGAGTRLCYGDYPFGTQWHLLPHLDFVKYIR
jgi:hypothetical protein